MSVKKLPTVAAALASVRRNGDPFASAPLAPQPLGKLQYRHKGKLQQVRYDPRVMNQTGAVFTNDQTVLTAVRQEGYHASHMLDFLNWIGPRVKPGELVWGVSGFASIGYPCREQVDILERVYRAWDASSRVRPAFVVDGASGAGVLAANGYLGLKYGQQVIGISPLQGIESMGPRSMMLFYGQTYEDRERIVGQLPQVLLVVGGGIGALREAIWTAKAGGVVVLLGQTSSHPQSLAMLWRDSPELRKAKADRRLFLATGNTLRSARMIIKEATARAQAIDYSSRPMRLRTLLAGRP